MSTTGKWVWGTLLAVAFVLGASSPAAAVTSEQRMAALSDFTQASAGSYNFWNAARNNQGAWFEYQFDWSTDFCSASPDQPLGFDFRLSCHRHDFGYRNFKMMGLFQANKARVDSAFYEDLRRKCATYHWSFRPACHSLAWTYYTAVDNFGSTAAVSPVDLAYSQSLMP